MSYLEKETYNKKHKGVKKGSPGLEYENFAQRIKSIVNFNTFEKPPADTKKVSRLTTNKGEMIKKPS